MCELCVLFEGRANIRGTFNTAMTDLRQPYDNLICAVLSVVSVNERPVAASRKVYQLVLVLLCLGIMFSTSNNRCCDFLILNKIKFNF